jgi:sugar lactone lactonase YvrE
MSGRFVVMVWALAAWSGTAAAQSVMQTILGATPDGVAVSSASLNTPCAAIGDSAGNVYVGLRATRQVVRIETSGIVRLYAGTGTAGSGGDGGPARSAQLSQPCGLALDASGNLFIADAGTNRIRRVTPDGIISTFAGNGKSANTGDGGPATDAGLKAPAAVTFDINGNLLIADSGNHVLRMVTLDGRIVRVAGTGFRSSGGNDGPALEAGLDTPYGIAVDRAGNIYLADTGNNQIRIVTPDGNLDRYAGRDNSSTTGGGPFGGGAGDPTVPRNATLSLPTALAIDPAGNLYFIDAGNLRVRRITADGVIGNYAGTGSSGGAGDGGPARSANLSPYGLGLDKNGNLLIADGTNHRVRVVTAADGIINTLAGNGLVTYDPRGLAVNGDHIYFSDTANNRIRRFNVQTGEISLVAGDGQAQHAGDGDSALTASLSRPRGITFDASGNLYIADSGNHRVRKIGADGKIGTVAGNGTGAANDDDGLSATNAALYEPDDVAVDATGTVYVVERLAHRVRRFTVGGTITTVAGTRTAGGVEAEGGRAVESPLYNPQAIAIEKSGALLVADTGNQRIRRVGADGTIRTVAGNGAAGYGRDGGPATEAFINNPTGITADGSGNLYIGDTDNQSIRRVSPDGIIATVAGTERTAGFNGDGSPATQFAMYRPSIVVPYTDCSLLVADTSNQRIRRVWPGIDHSIATSPAGLQVLLDGRPVATPVVATWQPGTTHRVEAIAIQEGGPGVRYVGSGGQDVPVVCGPGHATLSVPLQAQYRLTATASAGGSVAPAEAWQAAGTSVSLTATPAEGFVFSGWEGDCGGTGACRVAMDGPKNVKANFAPIPK